MHNIRTIRFLRLTAALATFLCASLDLLYGPSRIEYPAPFYLTHLSALADTFILASTFYCAIGLIRGRYVAWITSVSVLTVAVGWYSIESASLLSPLSLVPLTVLCLLLATKQYYRIPIARPIRPSDLLPTFKIIITITALSVAVRTTIALFRHTSFHFLTLTINTLEYMYNFSSIFQPQMGHHYLYILLLASIGAFNYCLFAYALLRPIADYYQHSPQAERYVLELLETYGNSSEDYFKYFPHDKSYFFSTRTEGFVAYAVERGVCIALADPIARDDDARRQVLLEFQVHCSTIGWPLVFLGVAEQSKELYAQEKFSLIKIGESAVINLPAHLASKQSKNMRNIMNRFHTSGYRAHFLYALPDDILTDLAAISNSWIAHRGRREHQFAMGYFDKTYLRRCKVFAIFDEHNNIQAFVNLQPNYSRTKRASIDMLRTSEGAPPNTMDFLLYSLIEKLASEGWLEFDLGLAPLSGLDQSRLLSERGLHIIYRAANRWYSFRGLRRFKQKFHPKWEPVYLAYEGSLPTLAASAQAISDLLQYKQ